MNVAVESQVKIDLENINNAITKLLGYYTPQIEIIRYTPTYDELECICFLFFKYVVGTIMTDIDRAMCFKDGTQLGNIWRSTARTVWVHLNGPDDVTEEDLVSTMRKMTLLYYCFSPLERSFGHLGYISI